MANDLDESIRELERGLDRIGDPPAVRLAHRQPIDDDRDAVILLLAELRRRRQLDLLAIHDGTDEPLTPRGLEQVAELALAPTHQRREHLDARPFGRAEHDVGDLRRALPLYGTSTVGAVRCARSR